MNTSSKNTLAYSENEKTTFQSWQPSAWKCYLFGTTPDNPGITYIPARGNVPNRFVRWMMKLCFGCTWVKEVEK